MMSSDPDWEMIPKNIQITVTIFESGWWEFFCLLIFKSNALLQLPGKFANKVLKTPSQRSKTWEQKFPI